MTKEALTLTIPADARQLVTARVFAESVGRHSGMAEDRILDLKVVISDIATWLLVGASSQGSIAIEAIIEDRGIRVVIEPVGFPMPKRRTLDPAKYPMWSLDLVGALTEKMNVGSAINFLFPTQG